jgi:hypothetical protein
VRVGFISPGSAASMGKPLTGSRIRLELPATRHGQHQSVSVAAQIARKQPFLSVKRPVDRRMAPPQVQRHEQVQAHDVAHLVDEQGIGGKLERLGTMGLAGRMALGPVPDDLWAYIGLTEYCAM